MEKLFLIDAYALIFRFYYAFIGRPMRNSKGLNTSAIYGFAKFIEDIIKTEKPHHIGVAFDPKGGNFRHQMFEAYKANRSQTPEDIIASIPYIKRILEAMRIPILEVAGYEADDVIGTIAKKAGCNGYDVFMVTPDKDYGQLVDDCIHIYKPRKGGSGIEVVRKADIMKRYEIDDPIKVIDILALWGDSSDNVPGVPGVGEKSAIKLVSTIGTVEQILENTNLLKGKQKENIEASVETLLLAKKLVTIDLNVPIEYNPEALVLEKPNVEQLIEVYTELEFSTFIHDLKAGCCAADMLIKSGHTSKKMETIAAINTTPSLFDDDDEFRPTPKAAAEAVEKPVTQSFSLFDVEEESDSAFQTIETTTHLYTVVDGNNIDMLVSLLSMQKLFCFDTETSGLDPLSSDLVGLSVAWEKGKAYYMPFSGDEQDRANLNKLKPLFENESIAKIGQNIKFDLMVMQKEGVEVKGMLYDTMIIHYLINSDERHGMDYLSEKYLNYHPIPISELIGKGAKQLSMRDIEIKRVAEYAAEDADVTFQLYQILWQELSKMGLTELYLKVEEPLIRVLAGMESAGVRIDTDKLAEYATELEVQLAILEQKIREVTAEPALNINSPKQLGEILFDKLKIIDNPKKTKTKQYKTDEESLTALSGKHEAVDLILEYRGLKKLLSTYVLALPKLINNITGRLHTSYNQAVTTTGRLSSTNPNLQNIPIRNANGRRIRAAFIAEDGCKLLSADYSQVELRIMAHLSGDEALCAAFNSGADIHTATAAKIYKIEESEVTSDLRRKAKSANFGIIYGISTFGLAEGLKISRAEAKELIDGYFESYPKVKTYMDDSINMARQKGYAETIYGRRRYLAEIVSGSKVMQGYAERNAINAPIQGSAADIMKLAMSTLYERMAKAKVKSRVILQVHDELVLEVRDGEEQMIADMVRESMEGAAALKVPLEVEYGIANSWLDAH